MLISSLRWVFADLDAPILLKEEKNNRTLSASFIVYLSKGIAFLALLCTECTLNVSILNSKYSLLSILINVFILRTFNVLQLFSIKQQKRLL